MTEEHILKLKDGSVIKITGGEDKNNFCVSAYSGDYKDEDNHEAIHINVNTDTGKGKIVEHGFNHSNTETTDTQCYLTTAVMKHMLDKFDDNCYYLDMLRWFRDNYVSKEDKMHYYEIAPKVVESINKLENANKIYEDIYKKVIQVCVRLIEIGKYDIVYDLYKNSVLNLENTYIKKLVLD